MPAPRPNNIVVYVDKQGRLMVDFIRLLQLWADILDDHEARITALEP
jgi:hypothetical protein